MNNLKFRIKGYRFGEYENLFISKWAGDTYNYLNRNIGNLLSDGYSLSAWLVVDKSESDLWLYNSNKLHDYDVGSLCIAAVRAMDSDNEGD